MGSPVKAVNFWGMYDCHLFQNHTGISVLNSLFKWIYQNSSIDLGPTDLCPARVVYENGRERTVGVWVEWGDWAAMYRWIEIVSDDDEIRSYFNG